MDMFHVGTFSSKNDFKAWPINLTFKALLTALVEHSSSRSYVPYCKLALSDNSIIFTLDRTRLRNSMDESRLELMRNYLLTL